MLRLGLPLFCLFLFVEGRKYSLSYINDERSLVVLSSFGYVKGGSLEVNVTMEIPDVLHGSLDELFKNIGFSLDKSRSDGMSSNEEREESSRGACIFDSLRSTEGLEDVPRAIFKFNVVGGDKVDNSSMEIQVYQQNLEELKIYVSRSDMKTSRGIVDVGNGSRTKREDGYKAVDSIPVSFSKIEDELDSRFVVRGNFIIPFNSEGEAGLYVLYFHNCFNIHRTQESFQPVTLRVQVVERNGDNYLSAGEMELPLMYGVMATVFFITGLLWIFILCSRREKVFMIHHLMAVFIIVKALSITFHSIDYHFIGKDGKTEAWAVIFYIVHLLKGILLFLCLILIGTGWAFIKYILSDREKKVFMVIIPLQVIANVAYIVIQESNEGNVLYNTWNEIMILVDILCCAAILIPVVWSVRHLQEASQTDGKAAINLSKLKLFQHFYVMVICYLYFTRIIVYLLKITLPFEYIWIHSLFSELGAFVFFVVTGYKFRPGCDNPYLRVPIYDEEDSHAITESGMLETVNRVNQHEKNIQDTTEEDSLIPKKRTSAL